MFSKTNIAKTRSTHKAQIEADVHEMFGAAADELAATTQSIRS
jgi:hypothetical protein